MQASTTLRACALAAMIVAAQVALAAGATATAQADKAKGKHEARDQDRKAASGAARESRGRDEDRKKSENSDELERLRKAAAAAAEKEAKPEEAAQEKTFKSGGLGLQKLNPEISITGDMLGNYSSGGGRNVAWDTTFRQLGAHLQAYLDPYSRFKAAVELSDEGADLEEAYFTRYGLPGGVNLTLGRFRQQFGIVNRWHEHSMDWFEYPLALRSIFGQEGLDQVGLSLETSGATGPLVHGLIVEVTDGDNPSIFGGNEKNRPSILGNYKVYQDLSPSTYLEVGATGLVGWNDAWTAPSSTPADPESAFTDTRTAVVYGANLNLLWEPTGHMRYRNIQWRSEAYFADKGIQAPDGSGPDHLKPWGLYSMLQAKLSRTVDLGVRYDYFSPEVKRYASAGSLYPLAVARNGADAHLAGAWVTWWQSPFVKFRGGYSYEWTGETDSGVNSLTLQMVFAAGPHKHERY